MGQSLPQMPQPENRIQFGWVRQARLHAHTHAFTQQQQQHRAQLVGGLDVRRVLDVRWGVGVRWGVDVSWEMDEREAIHKK